MNSLLIILIVVIIISLIVKLSLIVKYVVERLGKGKTNRYKIKLKHELDLIDRNVEVNENEKRN